jgi:hypothetical protein
MDEVKSARARREGCETRGEGELTLVASCFRGAFPPVDFRAVCYRFAMTRRVSDERTLVRAEERGEGRRAEGARVSHPLLNRSYMHAPS